MLVKISFCRFVEGDVGIFGFVICGGGVFGISEFFPRGLLIFLQLFISCILLFRFPVSADFFLKLRNIFLPGADVVDTGLITVIIISTVLVFSANSS